MVNQLYNFFSEFLNFLFPMEAATVKVTEMSTTFDGTIFTTDSWKARNQGRVESFRCRPPSFLFYSKYAVVCFFCICYYEFDDPRVLIYCYFVNYLQLTPNCCILILRGIMWLCVWRQLKSYTFYFFFNFQTFREKFDGFYSNRFRSCVVRLRYSRFCQTSFTFQSLN